MKKIQFDSGVKQFSINGGVLRFNPSDPNVYARFLEMGEKLSALEEDLARQAEKLVGEDGSRSLLELMQRADREAKQLFNWVFGGENDFDKLLEGVNLMAMGANNQQVVANLLDALEPILVAGAKKYADETVRTARQLAQKRREAQQ